MSLARQCPVLGGAVHSPRYCRRSNDCIWLMHMVDYADSSKEAKEKYKKKGSRLATAISIFPCAIRGSLIMNLAVFIVEEGSLLWTLIQELREAHDDQAIVASDARSSRQLTDLQKRKSPLRDFLRCVPRKALPSSPPCRC